MVTAATRSFVGGRVIMKQVSVSLDPFSYCTTTTVLLSAVWSSDTTRKRLRLFQQNPHSLTAHKEKTAQWETARECVQSEVIINIIGNNSKEIVPNHFPYLLARCRRVVWWGYMICDTDFFSVYGSHARLKLKLYCLYIPHTQQPTSRNVACKLSVMVQPTELPG